MLFFTSERLTERDPGRRAHPKCSQQRLLLTTALSKLQLGQQLIAMCVCVYVCICVCSAPSCLEVCANVGVPVAYRRSQLKSS